MINKNKVLGCLLCLFFLMKPFYFYESGLPQPSDLIFLFFILGTPWKVKNTRENKYILCFIYYTTILNLYFGGLLINQSKGFLFSSLFIIFLGLGALKIHVFILEKNNYIYIYISTILTTIVQFIIFIFYTSGTARELLFFNNPNQLGYFFLLNMAIFILISLENSFFNKYQILKIIPVLNTILIVISQSRAALGGGIILIIYYYFKVFQKKKKLTIIIIIMFILISLNVKNERFKILKIIEDRIEVASQKNDNGLAGRGYDRLYIYPKYLIFGSGEGGRSRFNDKRIIHNGEIHSLIANILFSYGFVGVYLFFGIISKYKNRRKYIYLGPIFIYNLTHNGVRNQLFWILIILLNDLRRKKKYYFKYER